MISRCTQIFLVLLLSTLIAAPAQGAAKLTAGNSSISPAEWTLVTASKAKLFEKYNWTSRRYTLAAARASFKS